MSLINVVTTLDDSIEIVFEKLGIFLDGFYIFILIFLCYFLVILFFAMIYFINYGVLKLIQTYKKYNKIINKYLKFAKL